MTLATATALLLTIGVITAVGASDLLVRPCQGRIVISQRDSALPHPVLQVATSVDGASIAQGSALTISWQAGYAPVGSAVALFPQKALTGLVFDPIAAGLPTSGHHIWQIPIFIMQPVPCTPDITGGCVGSMNPTSYRIIARLYTPVDANLTEFGPGKVPPTWIAWSESAEFTMVAAAGQ